LKPHVSSVNTQFSNPDKRILKVPKFKTREISFVSKCRFDGSFMHVAP
jgi:hypothetical protein